MLPNSWHIYHQISLIWGKQCRETQHDILLSNAMQLSSLESAKCALSFFEGSLIWITQFACQLLVCEPEDTERERLVRSDREWRKSLFTQKSFGLYSQATCSGNWRASKSKPGKEHTAQKNHFYRSIFVRNRIRLRVCRHAILHESSEVNAAVSTNQVQRGGTNMLMQSRYHITNVDATLLNPLFT